MTFDLKKPCRNCPFRSDREPFLGVRRAEEIASALLRGERFSCHKTVDYSNEESPRETSRTQFCAGALATMRAGDELMESQILRVAARLGLFDPDRLVDDVPVYGSLGEWVAAHRQR